MKSIFINLKRLFLSVWTIILSVFCVVMNLYYFIGTSGGNVGAFVQDSFNFNIFLQIFVSVVSVYMLHSTGEAEYGFLNRYKLFVVKYLSTIIYSLSSVAVPAILIVIGGVISSISPPVLLNHFLYYLASTAVQIIFTAALSIGVACIIKNKAAYIVSLAVSQIFSPFVQIYIRREQEMVNQDTFSLLNIVYDEPYRIRYSGYGAPFNSETILSWIITVLAALVIIALVLLLKRCYKFKGSIIASTIAVCAAVSIAPLTSLYFADCPVEAAYNIQGELDPRVESGEIPPELGNPPTKVMPAKIDFLNVYESETSPLVRAYKMELHTGNTVKNNCTIVVDSNGNDSVEFKLDECFKIEELLVNGVVTNYERNGSKLVIKDIANDKESTISIKYSGRMNYVDALENKTDFCDLTGGYFSPFFAWYPKVLSSKNTESEKDFEITVDACNTFVTNIDDFTLHAKGRNTVTGKQKDALLYIGYISHIEHYGRTVVLPTEFKNNKNSLSALSEDMKNFSGIYTRDGYFAVYDEDTTGLTEEEQLDRVMQWAMAQMADTEQIKNADTILILPITYNGVGTAYLDDNIIFMGEYRLLARCF